MLGHWRAALARTGQDRSRTINTLLLVILALGLAVRILQYSVNRSLWLDEAKLALNILSHGYAQLAGPLDDNQAAPYLFLVVEKGATALFGPSELALRLFPLLCGLSALLLCWLVVKRLFCGWHQLLPLALVCFSSQLIYYAQEVKQYSTEAAVALALYAAFLYWGRAMHRRAGTALAMAAIGAVGMWFSFTAVFVAGAVGATMLLDCFVARREGCRPARLALVLLSWAASFAGLYVVQLRPLASSAALRAYWSNGFLHAPADAFGLLAGFLRHCDFDGPYAWVAGLLALVGTAHLLLKRRIECLPLVLTFCGLLTSAALQAYPFQGRTALFAVAAACLLVCLGVSALAAGGRGPYLAALVPIVCWPALTSLTALATGPIQREEIKPLLRLVLAQQRAGDVVYIYHRSRGPVEYYRRAWRLSSDGWRDGVDGGEDSASLAQAAAGLAPCPRVWLLFSHTAHHEDEEQRLVERLAPQPRKRFEAPGARLYLREAMVRGPAAR